MPLVRTTLSGGLAATDTEVLLTSVAGLQVSSQINVDNEVMRVLSVGASAAVPVGVTRGLRGTNVVAHPIGATAVFGLPSEFNSSQRAASAQRRDIISYSASGAIQLPFPGRDMVAVLNGTTVRAMTLALPAKDNDGDILTVVGGGKAAHTVTPAGGVGGSALVAGTFDVGAQCAISFIAVNEIWVPYSSPLSGTLTSVDIAVA